MGPREPGPALPDATPHARDVKRALRASPLIDPFLCSRFQMAPYMACGHGCRYCDGRAEKYWVEGDFERAIVVRRNLPDLLRHELPRLRERAFIGIGSGITDAYQPLEKTLCLTRACAEVLAEHSFPVSLLTKSSLVERDLDLWEEVNRRSRCVVQMSITTLDEKLRRVFEPGAPPLQERIATLRAFRARGIPVGVMAMPLLPWLSDGADSLRALLLALQDAGAAFVMPAGLTLRPGRQKDFFMHALAQSWPGLVERYREIYAEDRQSGACTRAYSHELRMRIREARSGLGMPFLLPHAVYHSCVPVYDEISLLLQHMGELYAERGVDVRPLKEAGGRFGQWLLQRKAIFNRRRSQGQADLEAETRGLFEGPDAAPAASLLGNQKLARFLAEVARGKRLLDYATLTLNEPPSLPDAPT